MTKEREEKTYFQSFSTSAHSGNGVCGVPKVSLLYLTDELVMGLASTFILGSESRGTLTIVCSPAAVEAVSHSDRTV
jgi:hypothetical protein